VARSRVVRGFARQLPATCDSRLRPVVKVVQHSVAVDDMKIEE